MSAFGGKGKQNTKDNMRCSILIQCGIPIIIFFTVILVLVRNFSIISKNSAKESIYNRLINKSNEYATILNHRLTEMTYAGQSAAAIIGNEENIDYKKWNTYAVLIKKSVDSPYLVAIVDMNGKGVSSNSEKIDLSREEYFTETFTQKYIITKDDGILNKAAFISVIPINKERDTIGMLYVYTSISDFENMLPINGFDGSPAFALIDSKGKILKTAGVDTYFTQGENLIEHVKSAMLKDLEISKICARLERQSEFAFSTQMKNESKTIVMVPVDISDWQFVMVLDQRYVDREQYQEWTNAHKMITELVLAVCIFLGVFVIVSIINKLRYNEENKGLANKADTDLLTELNNKMATERKIQQYLEENSDSQGLMLLFDIDNFKKINDTMGHAFGDEVLRTLGLQLKREFCATDIIGRTGGDEFILFLKDIKSEEQLEREGIRITNFFHQFKAGEYVKYSATASVGAAVFPRDAKDFVGLYRAADMALYQAKRGGKNQLVFYNQDIRMN